MSNPIIGPDQNGKYWQLGMDASAGVGNEVPTYTEVTNPGIAPLSTYTVDDALKLAKTMAKGIPFNGVDVTICDLVNSAIYKAYPWRDTLVVITPNAIPLVDGQQDHSLGGLTMMRPTQFWLTRTDRTPAKTRDIDVSKSLSVDLQPKDPQAIRAAALQGGLGGKIRLESAVSIPTGSTWYLGGEYQPHPTKITGVNQSLWFTDEFLEVFAKGLIYWAYSLADRSEAGTMVVDGNGRRTYTGKLGEFMAAISDMAAAEDFGNIDGYYPDEPIGSVDGRRGSGDVFIL